MSDSLADVGQTRGSNRTMAWRAPVTHVRVFGVLLLFIGGGTLALVAAAFVHGWVWVLAAMTIVPGVLFLIEGMRRLRYRRELHLIRSGGEPSDDHAMFYKDARHLEFRCYDVAFIEIMSPIVTPPIPYFAPCFQVSLWLCGHSPENLSYLVVGQFDNPKSARACADGLKEVLKPFAPSVFICESAWYAVRVEERLPDTRSLPQHAGAFASYALAGIVAAYFIQAAITGEFFLVSDMPKWQCLTCGLVAMLMFPATWGMRRIFRA